MAADTIKFDKKNVKMVAHRGLSGIETENSNLAFTAAGQRTYYGIETDVHVTSDGQFIIIHDDITGRVSQMNIPVEGSTFEELRKIRLNDREDGVMREDIMLPTLDDYIKICRRYGKTCVLELKNHMEEKYIAGIIDVIKARDYIDNVIFISFDFENCKTVRRLLPDQRVMFLCGELNDDWMKAMHDLKIDVDIMYHFLLNDPWYMESFKKYGIKVNCWTVDSKEDAEKLAALGVDYITSNILE